MSYDSITMGMCTKHFAHVHFSISMVLAIIFFSILFFASLSAQICLTFFDGMKSSFSELINSKPFIIHAYTTLQSLAKP